MVLWSIRTFWYKGSAEIKEKRQVRKRALFLKNNNPGLKADFPNNVKKSMKSTIHKCTVNDIPVTNPTQYTKIATQNVKTEIRLVLGISISRIFRDNSPCGALAIIHSWVLPIDCLAIPS